MGYGDPFHFSHRRTYRPKDDHGKVFNLNESTVVYVPRKPTGWMNPSIDMSLGVLGWLMWPWFWLYDLLVRLTGR